MKRGLPWMLIAIIVGMSFTACAPSTAPSSSSPATQPALPTQIAPTTSQAPSEDTAWKEVVNAAKREGRVTFYSYTVKGDGATALGAEFEKKFGIKVDVITGRGSEMTERIKTEHRIKQVSGDVFETMATYLLPIKEAGLTVSLSDLPVLREQGVWLIEPTLIDSDKHVLPVHTITMPGYVNTKLVRPENEPKSFKDLMQPQWKRKIALSDPNFSTGGYNVFMTLVDRKILQTGEVEKFAEQEPAFFSGTFDAVNAVARGEYWLSMYNAEADVSGMIKAGAPIKAVPLDEGTLYLPSCIEVLSDSPHSNATKLFVNWILSQEGQTAYSKAVGLLSVRKDVTDTRVEGSKVTPKRIILYTKEDADRDAKMFREKYLVKLWKR